MMKLTLASAMRSFFGCDLRESGRIAQAQARSLRMVLSPWVLAAPIDLPGLPYWWFLNAVNAFNREMHMLVELKRREGCDGDDVLSRLIRAASEDSIGLSSAQIVGHASVVFAAGHETTSNALTFALFLISQHAEVHRALYSELVSEIGDGRPSLDELERLPILDKVVRETLRILPPAPWNARVTAVPVEVGGFELPVGTEVIGSIFHTHRIQGVYRKPDEFIPDRWDDDEPAPFEFNPFGGGARLCLGATFAMMEMKAVLATIVRRFRLAVCREANVEPVVNITMTLRHGLPITVAKQDGRFEESVVPVRGRIRRLVKLPTVSGD